MSIESGSNTGAMTRRNLLRLGIGGLTASGLAWTIPNRADALARLEAGTQQKEFRQRIAMNDQWKFRLDPMDVGELEHWYSSPQRVRGTISVPGCWQAQGYGEPTGTLRRHYIGPAWYMKEVTIPDEWREKKIGLVIGGAFTYTTGYVNGKKVGQHAGFSTPFHFDVTPFVRPGRSNTISFRVANGRCHQGRVDMAQNHFGEPTGCLNYIAMWGGLYGEVHLEAREAASIQDVAVTTDIRRGVAQFHIGVLNDGASDLDGHLAVSVARQGHGTVSRNVKPAPVRRNSREEVTIEVEIPNAQLWSPEEPNLYHARIILSDGARILDEVKEDFGLREVRIEGTKLLLNGKPLYLRGYGDDSVYIISGTPSTSKEVLLERLRLAKSFGFNAVRFHSWTPTTEFFEAADEIGLLIMAELPVESVLYFLPNRDFVRHEMVRIIQTHRNHPSWLSLALGNEFNVRLLKDDQTRDLLLETVQEFVELAKHMDPTRLVLSNDGYLVRPTDIASLYHGYATDLPTVKHEFGAYYCSLPDVSLIDKFTGVFRPLWLESKMDWLRSNGLLESYPAYLRNSWRLLQTSRKANIENLRRLDEIIGYQYWLMTDYPEGTPEGAAWEWGLCNYFWEPKGINPSEIEPLNSGVLPLLGSEVNDRTMWAEDPLDVDIFISNYGPEPIVNGELRWELLQNRRLGGGTFPINAPLGAVTKVGNIGIEKVSISEACKIELKVSASFKSRTYKNQWSFWAFPRQDLVRNTNIPVFSRMKWQGLFRYFPFIKPLRGKEYDVSRGLLITSDLSAEVIRTLERGGRVLVLSDPDRFDQQARSDYFPRSGSAIGIRIPDHPALGSFPHDGFPDLQFFNLLEGSSQFDLNGLESPTSSINPIINGIRTTRGKPTNEIARFSLLFEGCVGKGKLMLCTLNLRQNLDEEYPEAIYLLNQFLRYATSAKFSPAATMSLKQFSDLVVPYVKMVHSL